MQDNITKFQNVIKQKYLIKGKQNTNLKAIVNQAKFYQIEKDEALSIIKNNWSGMDFDKVDLHSFNSAWKEVTLEKTISDYKKQTTQQKIEQIQQEKKDDKKKLNLNILNDYLESVQEYQWSQINLTKTTEDLLYWYDQNDIVWVAKNKEDIQTYTFRDILTFSKQKISLNLFSYMAINPFKSEKYERKQTNIKTFRYFLVESDNLELQNQYKLIGDMIGFGIPIKSVIFSGGKSFHILCYLPKNIKNVDQYNSYVSEIYDLFSRVGDLFDQAAKNASRLTRIPFGKYDKEGPNFNNEQTVFYINKNFSHEEDALIKFKEYFKHIGLIIEHKKSSAQVLEKELLYYVNKSIICDIWRQGNSYFVKHKDFVEGSTFKIEKFTTKGACYEYCWQYKDEKISYLFDKKDWNELEVLFKQSYFQPTLKQNICVKKDKFNCFNPGWLGDIINDNNIADKLNKPLQDLLDNIFGEDKLSRLWTLKWMNFYMHNFIKMKTAPVFWGNPGIGKSMLAQCFGSAIGDWKAPKQSQIEDVRFNSWVKHAVLILDEVSTGSKKDGKAFGDYLKGLITQEFQSVENKGVDNGYDIKINNCFIFTANLNDYLPPVFLQENDRRYTIVRNDSAKNLIDIWSPEDFENWTNKTYQFILMKYIYNLDINSEEFKQVNILRGLDNVYKKQIQEMSKNNVQKLAEDFYEYYKGSGFMMNQDITANIQTIFGEKDPGRSFRSALIKLGAVQHRQKISGTSRLGYIF